MVTGSGERVRVTIELAEQVNSGGNPGTSRTETVLEERVELNVSNVAPGTEVESFSRIFSRQWGNFNSTRICNQSFVLDRRRQLTRHL